MADKFNSKTFNPEAFGRYIQTIPTLRRNELIKSRALRPNSEIRAAFSSQTGVVYAVIPMFGLLGGKALNYDGETDIDAETTDSFDRGVVVIGRSKAWVEVDFAEDITGGAGFMSNVARQVSRYWEDIDQDTLIQILKGIFAMAGNKGNLEFVEKHTLDITGRTAEAALMGPTTLNTAVQRAGGDKKNVFTLLCMHSTPATNLENFKLLAYLKYTDKDGIERDLQMGTWNGRTVLIDDNMPTEEVDESAPGAGDGYTKYTTYILGEGAFDFENIGAKHPVEMQRDAKTKGGQDVLYTRQRKVFAPSGISFTKKFMAKKSPTDDELAKGENWELVNNGESGNSRKYFDHKSIPIAQIISRG